MTSPAAPAAAAPVVAPGELTRTFARIGLESFGGPAAQIAVLHRVVVDEKKWLDERRFLHALNFCMLLPGPEAMQLATYCGWLAGGVRGGLVAGGLFVLPGFVAILALSLVYAAWGNVGWVASVFFGLKAAVLAVVLHAVGKIAHRALRPRGLVVLSVAAFLSLFVFAVPFPAVVVGAGVVGLLGARVAPSLFLAAAGPGDDVLPSARPSLRRLAAVVAVGLLLWFGPVAALVAVFGEESVFVRQGVFFSQAAVVTFGGAYAVLAWVAQEAVASFGWVTPGEMLDALALAETTPGPLIMAVQFVAFLGAHREPGPLDPWSAGILGSVVTTWVTFVPCFVWIFAGAPYVERLRGVRALSAALTAITAAVLGVIANLAVYLGLHVLFGRVEEVEFAAGRVLVPDLGTFVPASAVLSVLAFLALVRFRVPLGWVLAGCAAAGAAASAVPGLT